MRHRRGAIAGPALAVTALAVTVLPSLADAAPTRDASPAPADALTAQAAQAARKTPAAVLQALQRDFGLTAAEARERVANEHRAARLLPSLRAGLGRDFAGAWTRGDTAALTVATTDPDRTAAIADAGAEPRVVDHGLRELRAAKDALDRAARDRTPRAAALWYVDVRTNSVVVHSPDPAEARSFAEAGGADTGLVRVVPSTEDPRPYQDLRGGDAYHINGTGRCSIGFPVTGGSRQGFVTAGHCGAAGDTTTGHNQAPQGTFQDSTFPGSDHAWVAVNDGWSATPLVKGPDGDVTVSGSTRAPVGASVCRSGSTTGWHCGTIQQHDTSVAYPEGTVTGVTRTSVCAEPGDSGGSFVSGTQAQGVTSGGSGDCSSGGTTYYQPVNPILSAYNLTLVTG